MRSHDTVTLLVPLLLIAATLAVAGCTGTTQPTAQQTTLTVFAAASLTGAFSEIKEAYTAENPDVVVDFVFDGSQALRTQIEQGALPDVFVSANEKQMEALQEGGFMENDTVAVFLENSLAVIVPADALPICRKPGECHESRRSRPAGRQGRHRNEGRPVRGLHQAGA